MNASTRFVFLSLVTLSPSLWSQHSEHGKSPGSDRPSAMGGIHEQSMGSADCSDMEYWDYSTGTCSPLPMKGMPMSMTMVHGNAFLVGIAGEGPRARSTFAVPNMIMADTGRSVGDHRHYLNASVMLTFEKWTFPKDGYPELLQIGEENADGAPYIDAQHPHSSPIMGLTFSDTIRLSEGGQYLKVFFAPRGQATDGPTAFMHRQTGMINPDAPLGHHLGQDVSHITSTVIGASMGIRNIRIEISTFHGAEPEPAKVDLPLATPNSYAARFIQEFSKTWTFMVSAANVKDPEPHDPTIKDVQRYSASLYSLHETEAGWIFHNTFIFGAVNGYDQTSLLRSFLDEFRYHAIGRPHQYWGRLELVERAPAQLAILASANPIDPKWVTALTAGYTYDFLKSETGKMGVGLSITKNFLPSEFQNSYGGNPISGRIFVQVSGMKMGP